MSICGFDICSGQFTFAPGNGHDYRHTGRHKLLCLLQAGEASDIAFITEGRSVGSVERPVAMTIIDPVEYAFHRGTDTRFAGASVVIQICQRRISHTWDGCPVGAE